MYCYEVQSETHWNAPYLEAGFLPNTWVDITAHLETKLRALACYESRLRPMPDARSLCRDPRARSVARLAAELRGGGGVRLRGSATANPASHILGTYGLVRDRFAQQSGIKKAGKLEQSPIRPSLRCDRRKSGGPEAASLFSAARGAQRA